MRQSYVNFTRCVLIGILLVVAPGAVAQPGAPDLKLPVPRTFDLAHVEAKHYAVALGKDPAKIFEFVRDQIGYEVYTGALRGPRGTLLAMAGNSVDRAALLASLLKESGHRVQFVRGTLPKAEAKKLVDSIWVERLRPTPPRVTEPPPAMKAALDTLVAGVKRDYTLIRDHLKKANITPSSQSVPSLDFLVQEAQEHYWVQWRKDDGWVDLDPSFADATPGRKYTPAAGSPLDTLPGALFHRVTIRVRIEEYEVLMTGNAEGQAKMRDVLTYTAKAADLSGSDLLLTHQPENWKGPATSIASALSSAIESTGRVKPVLLIGEKDQVMGEPFRQKQPPTVGISGVFSRLSGEGTVKPVPIATAESIEFDFIAPDGHKETVIREIFDLAGKGRRAARKNLSADEVRRRIEAPNAVDVTEGIYSLSFTTGSIDAVHLSNLIKDPPLREGEPPNVRAALRRLNLTFAATSDAILTRIGKPGRILIRAYPDSPRVHIAELVAVGGRPRLSLDLRRDRARALAIESSAERVFSFRILRGVVEGALERALLEYVTADARQKLGLVMSTSSLFEQAQSRGLKSVLLTPENRSLGANLSEDTHVRAREELALGYVLVAPESGIILENEARFAWWRIDPRNGATTAVIDEGLHAATTTEYLTVKDGQKTHVFARSTWPHGGAEYRYVGTIEPGIEASAQFVELLTSNPGFMTALAL